MQEQNDEQQIRSQSCRVQQEQYVEQQHGDLLEAGATYTYVQKEQDVEERQELKL